MYKESNSLTYSEIVKSLQTAYSNSEEYIPLKIAFLRNITVEPILINYLKFFCHCERIKTEIYPGDYDNVLQDVMVKESPLYKYNPDIIIICLKKEMLCNKLIDNFIQLSNQEIEIEVKRLLNYFNTILNSIRQYSNAVILVHNFEMSIYPSFGILDYQNKNRQLNTLRRFNIDLLDIISQYKSTYIVDMDLLQSMTGYKSFIDNRYWHIGRAPYTREASEFITLEYMKFIKALKGKSKKCLVLDCDNTLWGGIIGEDGIDKIQIGNIYPGSAYQEFQQSILNLYNRGIILAICSKNNEHDVLDVFDRNINMVLKKEHFLVMKINWNDKVNNLKEIADELNIGLESIVFADDNIFEINMVRQLLPEVKTIHLSGDPSGYRDILNSLSLFDMLTYSDEDRNRNKMYESELNRKKTLSSIEFNSLYDYYKYLKMDVIIKNADEQTIPRISQLTQKTNQFNLTSRRYSEEEIEDFCKSRNNTVRYAVLKDCFGDSGIVGVAILNYENGICVIDTFLLSCRVIGRGLEYVLLKDIVSMAGKRGCKSITGLYIPTRKNEQVKDFYEKKDFIPLETNSNMSKYVFSLEDKSINVPDYFNSIKCLPSGS